MKKFFFFVLCFQLTLSAALVEWVSLEKYLTKPLSEEDKDGGVFERIRYKLAKAGHTFVETGWREAGSGDLLIWANIGGRNRYKKITLLRKKQIFINFEPPLHEPISITPLVINHFDSVFTWNDGVEKGEKVHKLFYPVKQRMDDSIPSFKERKLYAMVLSARKSRKVGELYSKRKELISFYEQLPNVSTYFGLYGKWWDKDLYKTYKGSPDDVIETLKGYKFTAAFENWSNDVGYITEKIFCAFAAGSVPVYLGASNVADYIPANCFIDARKFPSFEAMHTFLLSMTEEEWNLYQQRIRAYLSSEKSTPFSQETFANTIVDEALKLLDTR